MEIDNTKAFAKVFKELADYFYNIAPKKEVDEIVRRVDEETGWASYKPQRVIELDKSGAISLPVPQMPVGRDEFSNKEALFIEELNKNILEESDELNREVLLSVFDEIGCLITPTRKMLVDVGLIVEAAVLDDLLRLANFVRQLQSEGVLGYSDIAQYREDIKGKTDIAHNHKAQRQQEKLSVIELTPKETEYYQKAIDCGMAEKTANGYKWLYKNGSKASLAYFLYKLFNPSGTGQIPYQRLNTLWNVTRLDSALYQVIDAKNPQQWRTQIDNLFTN